MKPAVRTDAYEQGVKEEHDRIIKLLTELNIIRRCATTNSFVAVSHDLQQVKYLTGMERKNA
jgi:hypothetical protein